MATGLSLLELDRIDLGTDDRFIPISRRGQRLQNSHTGELIVIRLAGIYQPVTWTCRINKTINGQEGEAQNSAGHTISDYTLYLLEIIAIRLLVDCIEQRLRTEPPSSMSTNAAICVCSLLLADLDWMLTARCSSGLSHELRVTALLERDEPENGLTSCQLTSR